LTQPRRRSLRATRDPTGAVARRRVKAAGVVASALSQLWLWWLAEWPWWVVFAVLVCMLAAFRTATSSAAGLVPLRVVGFAIFVASLSFAVLGPLVWWLVRVASDGWAPLAVSCLFLSLVVASLLGQWIAARRLTVRRLPVDLLGLDPALQGLRIVQLSDLHFGGFVSASQLREWVRRTNELGPDLVVLSGDLGVRGKARPLEVATELGQLEATHGVIAVLGNHDAECAESLAQALTDVGIRVLRNQSWAIEWGDARLLIAGLDGVHRYAWDLDAALAGRRPGDVLLVVSHYPDPAAAVSDAGAALMLCGHTHGGQVAYRGTHCFMGLPLLGGPLAAGLQRIADTWVHQHTGLGTTGLPVRLGLPPEVVELTLIAGVPPRKASRSPNGDANAEGPLVESALGPTR